MIGRRQIREKVLQTIYAHNLNEIPLQTAEKNLFASIQQVYNLYIFQINLLIELKEIAINKIEASKKKNFKTQADLNPNLNFINNRVLNSLENNLERKTYTSNHKELTWVIYRHYSNTIYKRLLTEEFFQEYMKLKSPTFENDQKLIINIFYQLISTNESLHELYEELQLSWADDFHIANSMTFKTIKHLTEDKEVHTLIKTFKDIEDKQFTINLLHKTINFKPQFYKIIEQRTIGWEMDRVAIMDKIILSMALCELNYLKTPAFVTINEYIELAKSFSIPNSKVYINGILDKYIKDNNLVGETEQISDDRIIEITKKKIVLKNNV